MSKKPLPPEKKEECLRLKAIFNSKKAQLGLTQERLAHALEMNQSSVSHYLNGVNPLNPSVAAAFAKILAVEVAEFSERLANEIAKMAQSVTPAARTSEVIDVTGLPAPLAQKISSYRALVDIERFDIAGSMGPGTEPPEMNMVVEHMSLDAGWVRQNLVYTAIENLKLISGRGDSMAPTIRSGDALIADIGVTSVESDAIYFFLMRGQQHVKRIQRNLDGLTIISDNSQYREIDVPADRESDIQVLAQIIYWWTGRSF